MSAVATSELGIHVITINGIRLGPIFGGSPPGSLDYGSGPFKSSVHQYRHAKWMGTFYLPAGEKAPPPIGFTGKEGRFPTEIEIQQWNSDPDLRDANIAVWLGPIPGDPEHQVVGIDVDHYLKKDRQKYGGDQLAELEAELGALPPTWVSSARADGISGIRFYRAPADLACPSQLADDIEFIHRGHRYVVLSPSINPETNTMYQWYPPGAPLDGESATNEIPAADELPLLPETWTGYVGEQLPRSPIARGSGKGQQSLARPAATFSGVEVIARVKHADALKDNELVVFLDTYTFEDKPAALDGPKHYFAALVERGGSRHNEMRNILAWAFREAIVGCYASRRVYDELSELFLSTKADHAAAEFDDLARWAAAQALLADPADTLARAYRNEISERVTQLRIRDIAQRTYASERAQSQLSINAERALDGMKFLANSAADQSLWGHNEQILWAPGEGLMIAGPQGVGKSTVAQQLVLSRIGIAEPQLFGFPVATDDRPVLYLAMDRPAQIRRSLARMVDLADEVVTDRLQNNLIVWTGPLPLDAAEAPKEFAEWVKLRGKEPGLVIVDSLKDLATGLASDEVGSGLNAAIQRVLADGTEVALLHHLRKSNAQNPKPDKLDDIYGSAWLTAGLGSIVLLWGRPGAESVELSHLKQPQEPVGPLIVNHGHRAGQSIASDPIERLRELARNAGPKGFTLAEAIMAVYSVETADPKYRSVRSAARRRLDKLTAEGFLLYLAGSSGGAGGGGQAARWFSTDEQTPT